MPAERNAFKLGLTMIVFFSLLIGVLVFLAPRGGGDMVVRVRFPHTEFNTVLKPGGDVSCGGKSVGSIKQIDLEEMPTPDSGRKTLYSVITFGLESSLDLRKDCKIVPEGMLLGEGGKLSILDRGVGKPVMNNDVLDGQSGADIAGLTRTLAAQLDPKDPASLLALIKTQLDAGNARSLMGKIHGSLDDLNALTRSINNEFNPQERAALLAKLHSIMDHVNDTTRFLRDETDKSVSQALIAKVHGVLDALNDGLTSAVAMVKENREPIQQTIGHVRNTSEILEQQIAKRIALQLDPANDAGLLAKVHVSLDRLNLALADIKTITAVGRDTIVLNKDEITRMVANLKETSEHLKGASKDIRRNPWRLFYQPTLEEAAQANVFDAARAFSEAATRLDDAVSRLNSFAEAGTGRIPADDKQLIEIREQLKGTFDQFSKAEAALWEQLKIK